MIWNFVGKWRDLENKKPKAPQNNRYKIEFNKEDGILGLIGIDSSDKNNTIRFCQAKEITAKIKVSSRNLTRIAITPSIPNDEMEHFISICNKVLYKLREDTQDVVLAAFKGNSKDLIRRRRLDFFTAKDIILYSLQQYKKDYLDFFMSQMSC